MKTRLFSVVLSLVALQFALADDFKTIDGKEYKNATVSRVEPDGVVISFSGGIVKIPFTELSPEIQKKYGYDSQAAAAYTAEQNEKSNALNQQRKAEEQTRTEERHKYWSEHSTPVPAERQSVAGSMHGSALDQRPVDKTLIYGRIRGHVVEGLLVEVLVPAFSGQERIPADATVLLLGNFPGFYDDDKIQVSGIPAGMRDHATIKSDKGDYFVRRTVRAFEVAQINKLTEVPSNVR